MSPVVSSKIWGEVPGELGSKEREESSLILFSRSDIIEVGLMVRFQSLLYSEILKIFDRDDL